MAAELVVGLVHHNQKAGFQQASNLGFSGDVAGGVVWGCEEHRLGLGGCRQGDGLNVYFKVVVPLDGYGFTPANPGGDGVHAKGGGRDDDVFAGANEHAHQQVNQFVGAIARHDV